MGPFKTTVPNTRTWIIFHDCCKRVNMLEVWVVIFIYRFSHQKKENMILPLKLTPEKWRLEVGRLRSTFFFKMVSRNWNSRVTWIFTSRPIAHGRDRLWRFHGAIWRWISSQLEVCSMFWTLTLKSFNKSTYTYGIAWLWEWPWPWWWWWWWLMMRLWWFLNPPSVQQVQSVVSGNLWKL